MSGDPQTSADDGKPGEVPSDDDTPQARVARWTAHDAAIGLAAERDELHARLADRDREVADLRERLGHLTNANGQLQAEKARLVAQVQRHGGDGSFRGRAYRTARRTASRVLRGWTRR